MRTKTIAVLEVAVVLCSMLLVVTLPAIATAASEDDSHPLGIYGNANEDDTIDMRDTTYIKLAIFGKKSKTDWADANYDGKISMLDVGQTKLIILGKEKKLILIDDLGTIVTLTKPLERIIPIFMEDAIRALGATDMVVGVGESTTKNPEYYPILSKKPSIGATWPEVDVERLIDLEPDTIIASIYTKPDILDDHLEGTGIQVVRIYPRNEEKGHAYLGEESFWPSIRENMLKLGYVLGEVENAREYVEWYDSIVNLIKERVSEIPEDEKPIVFTEDDSRGGMVERTSSAHIMGCKAAGAIRIGPGDVADRKVSVEWIIDQNPDVYVARLGANNPTGGYLSDEGTDYKAYYDEVKGLPGFGYTNAVKNDRVHIITGSITMKTGIPIGIAYQAKWYHPELFEDLDPQAIHQEYIDRFCPGMDFDVSEHGVFVYPKPAW